MNGPIGFFCTPLAGHRANINEEGIEEAISYLVVGVVFSIYTHLNIQHIRLGISRNHYFDASVVESLSRDIDEVFLLFGAETDSEVAAVTVRADEVLARDHCDDRRLRLDRTKVRADCGALGSVEVLETVSFALLDDRLPVLLVVRD